MKKMALPKASVIVPMYNRFDNSLNCIESLINQTISHDEFEVLLIDDGSVDDTEGKVKTKIKNHENVFYIKNVKNLGRSLTRNIGIQKSRGDILIFLDNDMIVEPNFVKVHIQAHKSQKSPIAVIGNIFYPREALNKSNFGRYIQSRAIGYRNWFSNRGIEYSNLNGKFFAGGNSSCLKKIVLDIGMFDTEFEKYGGEDEYFGFKLNKKGVKIVFEPLAKSLHNDFNVGPIFWSNKHFEIGKYSFKSLFDKKDYLKKTNLILLYPELCKGNFSLSLKSFFIDKISNSFLAKFVLWYVFKTDSIKLFYFPPFYKFAQVIWTKEGLNYKDRIKSVEY
jgi:GT2 family glycosyltransferase